MFPRVFTSLFEAVISSQIDTKFSKKKRAHISGLPYQTNYIQLQNYLNKFCLYFYHRLDFGMRRKI